MNTASESADDRRDLQLSYSAYLLRCWRESGPPGEPPAWRFSLEGVQDRQRHGFADLEALLAYLARVTQVNGDPAGPRNTHK
ncbi:MAG: hypothetical protein KDE59_02060 [Anaerolineales bacterium]|nr:hypothetical protein [Anaerolineales bacterium]MCB0012447.1 hypothetical protein [Anaerolineales bacterium]